MKCFDKKILSLILAGGKGERLYPLTLERTKPSVPFGGKYRIIDFSLSSLINSGIYSIYVLVQYKSQSLIEHIRTTWSIAGLPSEYFITVVPPQMRKEELKDWYRGTADSIYQNINLIYDYKPDIVIILSGDHIYRMDIRKMINYHLEKKAELTISTIPVGEKEISQLGIVRINDKRQVLDFKEKPTKVEGSYLASMGNYIFNTQLLIEALEEDACKESAHDFGRDIIPSLIKKGVRVYGYDFSTNRIPGIKSYERSVYWRDVGTIKSYWEANMDLLGEKPILDLDNQHWPIYASNLNCPPAYIAGSEVINSLVCEGSKVTEAKIKNSILGRGVKIDKDVEIENSIVMDFTHIKRGSRINSAIIDRFNTIEENSSIGYDRDKDTKNYYVDSSGIVVVRRGLRRTFFP
ncbi:MAG: glucose-1-phosphate adenylyltransferase [Candidatus Omnitrophota bacterium]|nr:MAG: glucose-1-phosphate adenylyltransferase [Candidatus Omnitrophota bacterium]HDN85766.1 glucose-1-phosphate adenylyltransferase [Candidatus Omnitrophota bacterium]